MRKKATCHPLKFNHHGGLCTACYGKKWIKENPEKRLKIKRRNLLKMTYGMTLDEYDALLQKQNFGCAICGNNNGSRVMFVDHDHGTNKVRGLLCTRCNCALGLLDDDIEKLKNCINYITGTTVNISALFSREV